MLIGFQSNLAISYPQIVALNIIALNWALEKVLFSLYNIIIERGYRGLSMLSKNQESKEVNEFVEDFCRYCVDVCGFLGSVRYVVRNLLGTRCIGSYRTLGWIVG